MAPAWCLAWFAAAFPRIRPGPGFFICLYPDIHFKAVFRPIERREAVHRKTPGQHRKRPARANLWPCFTRQKIAWKIRYFPIFYWKILYFCGFGWNFSGNFQNLKFFDRKFSNFCRFPKVARVAGFFENFCLKVAGVAGISKNPRKIPKVAGFFESRWAMEKSKSRWFFLFFSLFITFRSVVGRIVQIRNPGARYYRILTGVSIDHAKIGFRKGGKQLWIHA